jgi:hypothetical protein
MVQEEIISAANSPEISAFQKYPASVESVE